MGLPLGESAVSDPMGVVRLRQLSWLQVLVNSLGVAGIVHRAVACRTGAWQEPSQALRSALESLGWSVHRNLACQRAAQWPLLQPEPEYPGRILLTPVDSFPLPGAAFTDGSLAGPGGGSCVVPG